MKACAGPTAGARIHGRPSRSLPQTKPVRLTRRGRFVVVSSVVGALSIGGTVLGHGMTAAAGPKVKSRVVTVHAGETLWSLAARIAPSADPRVVVAQIEQVNHLSSDEVSAGQRLVISGVSGQ